MEALADAMRRFEERPDRFDPKALRAHAERFDRALFKERMAAYLDGRLAERHAC